MAKEEENAPVIGHKRKRPERWGQHTQSTTLGSVCIANPLVRQEMSRTPSYTMQYSYLTGQLARTVIVLAKPARCIGKPHSGRFWTQSGDNPLGLERLEWNETTPGRSFHSKPFVAILNFQATEPPTRTENSPTDFCGGIAQLDPKTGVRSRGQRVLLAQRTTSHANIPQGKPQRRWC